MEPRQNIREESHTTSTTSSTTMFHQSSTMESSHVSRVVISGGDGGVDEKKHSMAQTSTSQVKKVSGQPTTEFHGARFQEVKQEGAAPPMVSDKISMVKVEGDKVIQQVSQDSGSVPVATPPKKLAFGKKKVAPARFITPLQGVIAKEDDRVILECLIDGHPEPTVTWSHNDGPLGDDAQVKTQLNKVTLTISKVNQGHAGHYTCFIQNDGGSAQCTCDVIIKKTQFPPVISKRLQPVVVGVNERLHMEIDVTGTPLPEVSWAKDGHVLTPSDRLTQRSEGTRHVLIIQEAQLDDTGRYSAIATNAAGRAESLADVMVTQLIIDETPQTHKIVFTDVIDETKRKSESMEEGHVKNIKRAIEEVAVEASSPTSPVKMFKAPPKAPVKSPIAPPALPTPPGTLQQPQSESTSEAEEEIRRAPGKLKTAWPPLPTDEEADQVSKLDTSVEIVSKNVSSLISSFSEMETQSPPLPAKKSQPKPPPRPHPKPKVAVEPEVYLEPEPEPEYGYVEDITMSVKQEILPAMQVENVPVPAEQLLVPEPEPIYEEIMQPEPEVIAEPEIEYTIDVCHEPESIQQEAITPEPDTSFITSKPLSPVPEVISAKITPEPIKEPSPEVPELEPIVSVEETGTSTLNPNAVEFEPRTTKEVKTEISTSESSFYETKKSVSTTSYSTVETKEYITGIISSPEEPAETMPSLPEPKPVPVTEEPIIPEVEDRTDVQEPCVPEPVAELEVKEAVITEPIEEPIYEDQEPKLPESTISDIVSEPIYDEVEPIPEPAISDQIDEPMMYDLSPEIEYQGVVHEATVKEQITDHTVKDSIIESFVQEYQEPEPQRLEEPEPQPEPEPESQPETDLIVSEPVVSHVKPEPMVSEAVFEVQQDEGHLEYFVPETEQVVEFVPSPAPKEPSPEPVPEPVILAPEPTVPDTTIKIVADPMSQVPKETLPPKTKAGTFEAKTHSEFSSTSMSSQMSSFSSMASESKTMFVTSSDVQTRMFSQVPPQPQFQPEVVPQFQPQPEPLSQFQPQPEPQVQSSVVKESKKQPLTPLIMPERKSSFEETVKPPKAPERDDTKEQKKPKKKRESVIQIAKRLEETIVPMSPDEVPGGIRMFPSPKQPSTPVRETPTPTRETSSARATPTIEEIMTIDFKTTEKLKELEPFPFQAQEPQRRERPKSLPPPIPKKFIPGTVTDSDYSEYESDMESEQQRIHLKKIKFEAATKQAERPHSVGRDPLPPSAFDAPPMFEGGMRPIVLKEKEEKVKSKPKSVTPKIKPKVVEKFFAAAGVEAEHEIVKPVPKRPKKDAIPPPSFVPIDKPEKKPQPVVKPAPIVEIAKVEKPPMPIPEPKKKAEKPPMPISEPKKKVEKPAPVSETTKTVEKPVPTPEPTKEVSHIIEPQKLVKQWPPKSQEEESDHQETAMAGKSVKSMISAFSEMSSQETSISYQKKESHVMKQETKISTQSFIPKTQPEVPKAEPTPVYVPQPEPAPIYITPEPAPIYVEPEPAPVYVEPEPAPVYVEAEPAPVYVTPETAPVYIEPEPAPVYIEPEPAPVYIEPEPAPVYIEPETAPVYIEPEPAPVYIEPEPAPVYVEPEPAPVYIEPEPAPVYIEPEPAPVYVEPEPAPVYIEPEPTPVYVEPEPTPVFIEPEPAPVYIEPEPEPVYVEPEPAPAPIISPKPEPESVSIVSPKPEPAQLTGFRSVRAPTPKRGQTPAKSTPAPPPPFDLLITPEPVIQPTPAPVIKPIPKPTPKPVQEPVDKTTMKPQAQKDTVKKSTIQKESITKSTVQKESFVKSMVKQETIIKPTVKKETVKPTVQRETVKPVIQKENIVKPMAEKSKTTVQKETLTKSSQKGKIIKTSVTKTEKWPPKSQEVEMPRVVPSLKTRSQSLERPPVTEPQVMPLRPHEAPPSIYWSSNITVKEKRMSWPPQPLPQTQTINTTTVSETTNKMTHEEVSKSSQEMSTTTTLEKVTVPGKKVDLLPFPTPLDPMIKKPAAPSLVSIAPKQGPVLPSEKLKTQPIIPKREAIARQSAPPREGSVTSPIIQNLHLEPFPFAVGPDKGKRPRGRAPSMPKKFVPGSFTESEYESDYDSITSSSRLYMSDSEAVGYKPLNLKFRKGRSRSRQPSPPPPSAFGPPPSLDSLRPAGYLFSDYESDIPTSKESTPVPEVGKIQSKHIVQTVKLLASQITPDRKSGQKSVVVQKVPVASPTVSKVTPQYQPKPLPTTAHKTAPKAPLQTLNQQSKTATSSQMHTSRSSAHIEEVHIQSSQAQEQTAETVGVVGMRKKFEDAGGAVPVPRGMSSQTRHSRIMSPSPIRGGPLSETPVLTSDYAQDFVKPSPSVATITKETDVPEKSSQVQGVKTKPASPKSRKKTETVQMSVQELEESGYAADTEGTLPRRHAKTLQSTSSSNISSSSFSKSESFMSSSFSKSESKSFSSSEFSGQPTAGSFPPGFPSASGTQGGTSPGTFPFSSTPASSVGQTSHFSSTFKSSESKSSQMFTSRSEEFREERHGGAQGPKATPEAKPTEEEKKPKFEEFRRETHGQPGASGPFSEDTYYAMKDETDISTDGTRTKKKVEMKSETHVEVMSDKKVEVFESTSVDVSPKPTKKHVVRMEQKHEKKPIDEKATTKPSHEPKIQKSKPVAQQKTEEEVKMSSVTEHKEHTVKQFGTTKITKSVVSERDFPKHESEPLKKTSPKTKHKKIGKEHVKVPPIEPLKSTGLVKQVTKQEKEKEDLHLEPFPFEVDPERPKKPRGPPPSHPSKFKKGEFHESDYDSDYESKIRSKWKPADSDTEDQTYGKIEAPVGRPKVSKLHIRTPTPPTVFDDPPQFEGPARPKIDFPESEPEPEREASPEIVIPEKVEYVAPPEPPKVAPKEPKVFKSQPPPKKQPPPRSPSPDLQPGSPPEELYAEPKPKQSPFSNAIGVESTKITKIADSSAFHKRFVTMQQTTRVIKFGDTRTETTSTGSQQTSAERKSRPTKRDEPKREPLPDLEPFPFTPDPLRPKKERGAPPPKPKKFQKGEFTESDYDSDYEGRIRPKWVPPDSDAEEPNYTKVKPQFRSDRTPSKTRERTPTPPTVFDVPPKEGPWRPSVERIEIIPVKAPSPEILITVEEPKKIEISKRVVQIEKTVEVPPERPVSPELPPPGTPPEEGVIYQQTQYVVDKVDLKSRVLPPPLQEVQTFEDRPYTKIIERTEKTFTDMKLEEEMRMKKEKNERKTVTETEYELAPERPPPPVERDQIVMDTGRLMELEPFPFEVEEIRPKKDKGPAPPKPKKFYKGEFRESDYESDYEGKLRPKWKPADSDVEDPEYTPVRPPPPRDRTVSKSKERTPTPPSQFDVPPPAGEPLRPTIKPVAQTPVQVYRDPSPEIIIPKEEKITKSQKVVPKAPALKVKQVEPERPKVPTPPLPEPGPQPEIGYVDGGAARTQDEEDAHIRMIKKKIEAKKGFQIDIDITDIYDFVSESELEKIEAESGKGKPFPKLEPFPYQPDPHKPKRDRGPPPPQPKKFMKGEFRGSDYESDYDRPIAPKWLPPDSEGEERMYRRVAPPAGDIGKQRSESSGRDPSPPSKFDQPPQFEGPPRPVMELSDIPRRERRESLEEYSIPRFPKVEFKPFDLEDENKQHPQISHMTDTETEPELLAEPISPTKGGIDKRYAKTAQKVVSHQFEDMTQTFRHKAQKFAEQLVTEVFAAREGSVPAEPAGEPPSIPEELKKQSVSPVSTAAPPTATDGLATDAQEPQAYRDESRVSEFGTKHIDPDTGLIYFKYDFGYEFGVILPGEAKKIDKKAAVNGDRSEDIPIPVIHEKTESSRKSETSSSKTNGHVQPPSEGHSKGEPPNSTLKSVSSEAPVDDHISPQPSLQSDVSETDREYQQYMGKMIPEFVPKRQAQFRPICGDPYSDSEVEPDHSSPSKMPEPSSSAHAGPRRFMPLVPGAAVQPKSVRPAHDAPGDSISTITDLGAITGPDCVGGGDAASRVCGAGRPTSSSHVVQRGQRPSERAGLPDSVSKRCL